MRKIIILVVALAIFSISNSFAGGEGSFTDGADCSATIPDEFNHGRENGVDVVLNFSGIGREDCTNCAVMAIIQFGNAEAGENLSKENWVMPKHSEGNKFYIRIYSSNPAKGYFSKITRIILVTPDDKVFRVDKIYTNLATVR